MPLLVNPSSLFCFTFPVLPNDVSEDIRSCSPVPSSLGSVETFSLRMEEEEHMDKIRNLHINYRTQIQELQEQCRRNERTIDSMERAYRDDVRESLRLHERIIQLERV